MGYGFFSNGRIMHQAGRLAMSSFHPALIRFRIVKSSNAALRKNFSIQEIIFHIEKHDAQVIDC
jgi:predicted RNA binding protein with dsRBD fold (UPF0201 family)